MNALPSGCSLLSVLKQDALGRVLAVHDAAGQCAVLRQAGGTLPGAAFVARLLLARERRALQRIDGLPGVPQLLASGRGWLLRSWCDGVPLQCATRLPRDFFAHLEALLQRVHARGVAHNDLHKEPNVLVQPDGRPALLDFQLASVHASPSAALRRRAREDLRHVDKHAHRYECRGRPGVALRGEKRGFAARAWSRLIKPVYNTVTRRWLHRSDGEERRPAAGPWPEWQAPLGRV
jgi:serine/threonine protein kinase